MSFETLAKILDNHCINHKIENGRFYAEEVYTINGEGFAEWRDFTNITMRALYDWLGY